MAFWNTYANCAETGTNGVIKTSAADAWDAAARSLTSITGPCTVSFQCPDAPASTKMVGLGIGTLNAGYANRQYGLYVHLNGKFYIYESGAYRGEMGLWVPTDTFKVVSDAKNVTYYRNDVLFYRSPNAPAATLYAEAIMYTGTTAGTSAVDNVTFAAGVDVPLLQWDRGGSGALQTPLNTTVSAGGATLTKSAGATDWNSAGAQSVVGLRNCYLEFKSWATEATIQGAHTAMSLGAYQTSMGLNSQECAITAWDINAGFAVPVPSYNLRVYATNRAHPDTQGFKGREAPDIFRLERIDDRIYAYKNGRRFFTTWPGFYALATQTVYASFSGYAVGGEATDIVFQPIDGPTVWVLSNVDFPRLPTNNALSLHFRGYWSDLDTSMGQVQIGPSASGPWTTMWSYAGGFAAGYATGSQHTVTSAAKDERIRIAFEDDLDPETTYYVRAEIFNVLGESTVKEFSFETTRAALSPTVIVSGSSAVIGVDATRTVYTPETDTFDPDIRAGGKPYLPAYSDAAMQSSLLYESDGQIVQQATVNPAGTMNLAYKDAVDNWSVVSDPLMTGVDFSRSRSLLGTSHGGRRVYWGTDKAPPTIISYDFDTNTVGRIQCLEAAVAAKTMIEAAATYSELGQKRVTEDGQKIVGPYETSGAQVWVRISEDGGATWERVALPTAVRSSFEGPAIQLRSPYNFYWLDNDHLLLAAGTEGSAFPDANSGYNRLNCYTLKWSTREWDCLMPPDLTLLATEGNFGLYQTAGLPTRICWPMPGNRIWWRTGGGASGNMVAVTDYNGCILAVEENKLLAQPNSLTGAGYYGGGYGGVSQWASPTEFTCISQQDTSKYAPSRHLLQTRHVGVGKGGLTVQAVDLGAVLSTGYTLNVFGSYKFAPSGFAGEDSISFTVEVDGIRTEDSIPFNVNITGINAESALAFKSNVESTSILKRPIPVQYTDNPFTHLGKLVSLKRGPEEKNAAYRRRVMDTYSNMANSTYTGMINGITRELGLSLYEGIEVNPKTDSNGNFLAPDPLIVFNDTHLLLYSDYGNGQLDWAIDRLEKGGNYEHLGSLVDFVNTTSFFEAAMRPNVSPFSRSSVILNQTNRMSVDFEYVKASTKFRLKKWPVVEGSVFFSNPSVFSVRKPTSNAVSKSGDYHVDYNAGIVTVFTSPGKQDSVRYQYTKYPFYATASPIVIHDLNGEAFKTKMFQQIFSDDENDYVNGLPTELGVDIINELLSISPMYWGE